MDIQEAFDKALKETDIIRSRIRSLETFEDTRVPYIILSASSINPGDTVVRQGEVLVQKPSLILPAHIPQFEGFDADDLPDVGSDAMINFLLVRGISLPSLKYNNTVVSLDIFEGGVQEAVKHHGNRLESREDTSTGLLVGPEDVWPFSLLVFICAQIANNSSLDMRRLMERWRKS